VPEYVGRGEEREAGRGVQGRWIAQPP